MRFLMLNEAVYTPTTVAALSKAWIVFVRSNTEIVGSNPTQSMDVCVPLFCICVLVCRQRQCDGLIPPSKKSYRLCTGLRN
jgi:hypothetical protein